jgi:hypothetical protein
MMLWSFDPDPRPWRYKTRGPVLRLWAKIKREMYEQYCRSLEAPF